MSVCSGYTAPDSARSRVTDATPSGRSTARGPADAQSVVSAFTGGDAVVKHSVEWGRGDKRAELQKQHELRQRRKQYEAKVRHRLRQRHLQKVQRQRRQAEERQRQLLEAPRSPVPPPQPPSQAQPHPRPQSRPQPSRAVTPPTAKAAAKASATRHERHPRPPPKSRQSLEEAALQASLDRLNNRLATIAGSGSHRGSAGSTIGNRQRSKVHTMRAAQVPHARAPHGGAAPPGAGAHNNRQPAGVRPPLARKFGAPPSVAMGASVGGEGSRGSTLKPATSSGGHGNSIRSTRVRSTGMGRTTLYVTGGGSGCCGWHATDAAGVGHVQEKVRQCERWRSPGRPQCTRPVVWVAYAQQFVFRVCANNHHNTYSYQPLASLPAADPTLALRGPRSEAPTTMAALYCEPTDTSECDDARRSARPLAGAPLPRSPAPCRGGGALG